MINIDTQVDLRAVDQITTGITKRQKEAALRRAAARFMGLRRQRVRKGRATNGARFAAYSRSYYDRKRRAGRIARGSWLRLSGAMWRSERVFFGREGKAIVATITFDGMRPQTRFVGKKSGPLNVSTAGAEMVLSSVVAAANDRTRPFIGISKKEQEDIRRTYIKYLDV